MALVNETVRSLDRHLGAFIARIDGSGLPMIRSVAEALGQAVHEGAVCLDLARWTPPGSDGPLTAEALCRTLEASPAVGRPGANAPLILDAAGRLYLYRLWAEENGLAEQLLALGAQTSKDVDETALAHGLTRHFPDTDPKVPNWQAVAAAVAVLRRLTVVSGGPGTGKTYTTARIIALLAQQAGAAGIRIALTAPTGKAAIRLQESVTALGDLPAVTVTGMTVHRLLGVRAGGHSESGMGQRPIRADVVVVDEASMISLSLLSRLVRGLPPHARLILVGDHNQLASVSPGAVLGDICTPGRTGFTESFSHRLSAVLPGRPSLPIGSASDGDAGLSNGLVFLERPYRFSAGSAVDRLGQAILAGDAESVNEAVANGESDCRWYVLEDAAAVRRGVVQAAASGYAPMVDSDAAADALARLDRFRVLTVTRNGRLGASGISEGVIEQLVHSGRIRRRMGVGPFEGPRIPIMVTRNDYHLGLFNGDAGILWEGDDGLSDLVAVFPTNHGQIRQVAAVQLSQSAPAFAITVHKSQGSEFDDVHVVLPTTVMPMLTRELLYTAVTRARHRITLWGGAGILRAGIGQRIQRRSGLKEFLWGSDSEIRDVSHGGV